MTSYYVSLFVLLVAVGADLCVPIILGYFYPGYNHFYHTISALGTDESPVKIWQAGSLVCVGIFLILFAIGQAKAFSYIGLPQQLYLVGIVLFGIGCVFAGLFPEDAKNAVTESLSGKIHGIASGIGFICLLFNPLWAFFIDDFLTWKSLNILLFIVGILSFIVFIFSNHVDTGFWARTGLFQRINLLICYGGLILNYCQMNLVIGCC